MMRNFFSALLIFIAASCAPKAGNNTASASKDPITVDFLKQHLSVIASPAMEGRNTPSAGLDRAADYIQQQYKSWGLLAPQSLNGYRQYYPLTKDSLLSASFSLSGQPAVYGSDFVVQLSNNANANISSEGIVFAGYGITDKYYDDYKALDVAGKLVVIALGEPVENKVFVATNSQRGEWGFRGLAKKLALAKQKGAAGVLLINPAQSTFDGKYVANSYVGSVQMPRPATAPSIPSLVISRQMLTKLFSVEEADKIFATANLSGKYSSSKVFSSKSFNLSLNKIQKNQSASNVVAMVEGSDKKDEYVVVSAHYDHLGIQDGKIYNGADDDGSGTVAVMAMAKAFADAKAAGKGPRRTIVFLNVSGEEKGLWGSEYYASHPALPLEKTSANLNIDMIGRVDTERKTADSLNYVYVVGHNKLSSNLSSYNVRANASAGNLVLDYKYDDPNDQNRIYYRSDHYNFAKNGVPALFFYDGMLKGDYHKPTDNIEFINWELYRKRALLVYHTAWEIANADEMVKRDIPLPPMSR